MGLSSGFLSGLFSSNKTLLAVDIGGHSVKVARLSRKKTGYELLNFGIVNLPPDTVLDGEIENPKELAESIRKLLKSEKVKEKEAVIGICGQSVVIKKISVPYMSEEELNEMIREEAEQYIPFDINEVNLDFQIVHVDEEGEKQMDVIIVAVQKSIIQSYIDVFKSLGMKVKVVDLSVFALENIYELVHGLEFDRAVALVNIGASMTNVNIVEKGATAFARDIQMGSAVISEEIQKSLSVGFSDAEKMKLGELPHDVAKDAIIRHVLGGVEEICIELRKTLDMFEKTSEFKVSKIYLAGGGCMLDGIERLVADQLKLETATIDPFAAISYNVKNFDPDYLEAHRSAAAIPLGLALRTADDKGK